MNLKNISKNLRQGNFAVELKADKNVLWFDEIGIKDIPLVGGKNASLGEMYQNLTKSKVKVPYGFAVTSTAYKNFISHNDIENKIQKILQDLDKDDISDLQKKGKMVRNLILESSFPTFLENQIIESYKSLKKKYGSNLSVAIRSSATAEDLPDASFAGQQETYLNVYGEGEVLRHIKYCFASLFTNRAISYRIDKNFSHFDVYLSVCVQVMIRSDMSSSGVMFSIDTESGFDKVVFITAAYGLGENVVQGAVNPDEYLVFKPTLDTHKSIISKKLGSKEIKMVYDKNGHKRVRNEVVGLKDREQFALDEDDILCLAKWAKKIEEYYSKLKGHYCPMDIEWAKDGISGNLYIVQARPETIHSKKDKNEIKQYRLLKKSNVVVDGLSVSQKIGQGRARIIENIESKEALNFKKGDVLITDITDPDWEPIMKKASAIITNRGGRTCHAAIIAREMGVPCIVGCHDATTKIKNGQKITIDCADGEIGKVYEGILDYKILKSNVKQIPKTMTNLCLNVANPDDVFSYSFLNSEGAGLVRAEFILNSKVKIHPNALLYFKDLQKEKAAKKDVKKIEELTKTYDNKLKYYVDEFSFGIAKIASAFYPKKAILRFSDFKSNEYSNLIGGKFFEPKEENPMIGFRGASRYYNKNFIEAFKLECLAVKKVREEFGLTNLKVMIPFCRTQEELLKVLEIMKKMGLVRGKKNLEVYVMCEIPSNVILADEFLKHCDGYSIGSNDLTQLTLGLDRDSEIVSNIYDERNDAVRNLILTVINKCRSQNKYIGICGQAPSDYLDFTKFLVEAKIDAISLNPDAYLKTKLNVAKIEREHSIKTFKEGFLFDKVENNKTKRKKK